MKWIEYHNIQLMKNYENRHEKKYYYVTSIKFYCLSREKAPGYSTRRKVNFGRL